LRLAARELALAVQGRLTGRPEPRDLAVALTAEVDAPAGRVTLHLGPGRFPAEVVTIRRRPLGATRHAAFGAPIAELRGDPASFVDGAAPRGALLEYAVTRRHARAPWRSEGRIAVAVDAPLHDLRGRVLLVVERAHEAALARELERLVLDLVGDGWEVARLSVASDEAPAAVKARIVAEWAKDRSLRAVFLFGRVPVPYSGNTAPDGHEAPAPGSPGHRGAWPADVFYADPLGTWTDEVVDTSRSPHPPARHENQNVPGDGKLDQDEVPWPEVTLEVGRVDLSRLPALGLGEVELLRRYLDKDHAFRHGERAYEARGLIDDNFGYRTAPKRLGPRPGKAFSSGAHGAFAALAGPDRVVEGDFFRALRREGHLVAHASGPGRYDGCAGVGTTRDFRRFDPKCPFVFLLGSYFGDWDTQDSFLRAPLATSHGLASGWSGLPDWSLHVLGAGETLGYAVRHTQNAEAWDEDRGAYVRPGASIHVALHGDPTLPLRIVPPPRDASVEALPSGAARVTFRPARGSGLLGHHVYRAADRLGPYARLTAAPVPGGAWIDPASSADAPYYLVRAVARIVSPSGSYLQASQGAFAARGE
jgi:hypothetical protein